MICSLVKPNPMPIILSTTACEGLTPEDMSNLLKGGPPCCDANAGGRAAPIGRAEAMRETLQLAVLAGSAGAPLSCGLASIPPLIAGAKTTVNAPRGSEGSLP